MKDKKRIKSFNKATENFNISDIGNSFTTKDLFEAFSHYAFASISNQPYNEEELMEEFKKWFKHKYQK